MKVFKYVAVLFCLALFNNSAYSQEEKSDPATTKLLDKINANVKDANSIQADFELVIALPETEPEIQAGNLLQKGDQYKVDLGNQALLSDGNLIYFIFKDQNAAQLQNADDMAGDNLLNPLALLEIYKSGEYIYSTVGEENVGGKIVTAIEFKPVDRYSEYSKIRLAVDELTLQPSYIKVFVKDGSRYTLNMKNLTLNVDIEDSIFKFNENDYPGIVIEDLRI